MEISINTLLLAMYAVQRDIRHHETLNNSETSAQDEREEAGQYALDLTAALGELGMLYRQMQAEHPECPVLDELEKSLAQI